MDAEVLVLGTGGVGSAALYHLARRGVKAIGIDRFPPGHDRGSSHGRSRLIRLAYFEHPHYVPLLQRAYTLWEELQTQANRKLYHEIGVLEFGPPDGELVSGVLTSARQHGLEVEQFDAAGASRRFPGFRVPDGNVAVFERRAGYLVPEECVKVHALLAQQLGAQLLAGDEILSWESGPNGVNVHTTTRQLSAERLIIAAGPWTPSLLADLKIPLQILRKTTTWFACDRKELSADAGCPAFLAETPDGFIYGVPRLDALGVKVARHSGGNVVTDPLLVDREIHTRDLAPVVEFSRNYLGMTDPDPLQSNVCMYTVTPDNHFIVDHHPQSKRVAFAAGLSGHGFKFTSVLGEILAEMVLDGQSKLPVEFLGRGRLKS